MCPCMLEFREALGRREEIQHVAFIVTVRTGFIHTQKYLDSDSYHHNRWCIK